jgi:hypothetical protein
LEADCVGSHGPQRAVVLEEKRMKKTKKRKKVMSEYGAVVEWY